MGAADLLAASRERDDTARLPGMRGPEGRPPNVSPARKGWGSNLEHDVSAVGAALNLTLSHLCHEERKPTCPGVPWRDLQFAQTPNAVLRFPQAPNCL
jgi:hypothetical protein